MSFIGEPPASKVEQIRRDAYEAGLLIGRTRGLEEAAALAERAGCGKEGCTDCVGGALAVTIRAAIETDTPDRRSGADRRSPK